RIRAPIDLWIFGLDLRNTEGNVRRHLYRGAFETEEIDLGYCNRLPLLVTFLRGEQEDTAARSRKARCTRLLRIDCNMYKNRMQVARRTETSGHRRSPA